MILNDVITTLAALFDAAVTAPVYDTPDPTAVNNASWVSVSTEGEDDDGATVELTPSQLGPGTWFDEAGEVVCSAWSQSGGTDTATRRTEAAALALACVAAVRADDTLGGLLTLHRAEVSALRYRAFQGSTGTLCRFSWTVSYRHLNI